MFPHPDKYSWGLSYEYLPGLLEPTKFMSYYLRKCLKLYVSQTRKLSRYLLLTVNVYCYGLVSILTSVVSLEDPLQCLKSLSRVHSGRLFSYSKKRKITQNHHSLSLVIICCHSLSFDVIRCHSLSLIVPLVVTRCTTRCHSLSFVVTRCTTRCHSLSLLFTRCITLSFYKRSLSPQRSW